MVEGVSVRPRITQQEEHCGTESGMCTALVIAGRKGRDRVLSREAGGTSMMRHSDQSLAVQTQ